jgi:hypothetical protein
VSVLKNAYTNMGIDVDINTVTSTTMNEAQNAGINAVINRPRNAVTNTHLLISSIARNLIRKQTGV